LFKYEPESGDMVEQCGLQLCPPRHSQKDSKVTSSAASASEDSDSLTMALYKDAYTDSFKSDSLMNYCVGLYIVCSQLIFTQSAALGPGLISHSSN